MGGCVSLQQEVELANELTLNVQFAIMVNENWENWLNKTIQNLENLLEKEKKDNDILRNRENTTLREIKFQGQSSKRPNQDLKP